MTYYKFFWRVEMRVMLAMTVGAVVVSSILYVCALVIGVIGPWAAAVLGIAGTFYVIAVPAMPIYAPVRALRLRSRVEFGHAPRDNL